MTVPPFVTVDGIRSAHLGIFGFLRNLPLIQQFFARFMAKEDLSEGYQNPKTKLGVTAFFRDN